MQTPERPKKIRGDRFIPSTVRRTLFADGPTGADPDDGTAAPYQSALRSELFGDLPSTVFSYGEAPGTPHSTAAGASPAASTPGCSESSGSSPMACDPDAILVPSTPPRAASATPKAIPSPGFLPRCLDFPVSPSRSPGAEPRASRQRKVSPTPVRTLDAPGLADDCHTDVLDFGANNHLLVALGCTVYIWNAESAQISVLTTFHDTAVSSVRWLEGPMAAVGLTNGKVLVLDATTCQPVSEAAHHSDRVGCLAWNPSLGVLGSGSRDHRVVLCDPRGGAVQEYAHHTQEVCGLRWSTCGNFIASGGDDGQLCVWSTALAQRPLLQTPLTAPVRALAWSPHAHGLLACGGGAADRRLHFFNAVAATPLASVDTGAQVCALLWAPNVNEIVSAHGDQNTEVVVWKYPRLTPVATLSGHRSRVLWLTGSPDGTTLVTGAGDETLRFWDVFPPARPQRTVTHSALSLSLSLSTIR